MTRRPISAALALVATLALVQPAFAALEVGAKAPDFTASAYLAGEPLTFKRNGVGV